MKTSLFFGLAAMAASAVVAGESYLLEGWTFEKDGKSETVRIPHDWAIAGPFDRSNDAQEVCVWDDNETEPLLREGRTGGLPVIGTGVYTRTFTVPDDAKFASLVFDGVMGDAEIRVDGRLLATRENGYAIFEVEIPDVKPGAHTVEVKATVPPQQSRWYQGGGLYRPVHLIETPSVCIDPTTDGSNGVTLAIDTNGTVVATVRVNARGTISTETQSHVFADPELWTPELPKLYSLHVEIASGDAIDIPFGFRTAELREDGFYLNGVRRKVRGVNRHQDVAGLGWEQTPAMEERDVRLMKAMGVDAVRLSHYPQSDSFLAACFIPHTDSRLFPNSIQEA